METSLGNGKNRTRGTGAGFAWTRSTLKSRRRPPRNALAARERTHERAGEAWDAGTNWVNSLIPTHPDRRASLNGKAEWIFDHSSSHTIAGISFFPPATTLHCAITPRCHPRIVRSLNFSPNVNHHTAHKKSHNSRRPSPLKSSLHRALREMQVTNLGEQSARHLGTLSPRQLNRLQAAPRYVAPRIRRPSLAPALSAVPNGPHNPSDPIRHQTATGRKAPTSSESPERRPRPRPITVKA